MSGPEQRRHPRIKIQLEVELVLSEEESRTLTSENMSQEGLFLNADAQLLPQAGSEVYVRLKGALEGVEPPLVRARVVRVEQGGIGLHFEESGDPDAG